jgi:protease I
VLFATVPAQIADVFKKNREASTADKAGIAVGAGGMPLAWTSRWLATPFASMARTMPQSKTKLTKQDIMKQENDHAQLEGKRVAILVANGFEQSELISPRKALEEAGAETEVVSPLEIKVKGWDKTDWGTEVEVDIPLRSADPEDYDALLLPGGVMNPDKLRRNPEALDFVKAFFESGKPVGAICHGPWTLIDAGVVRGRTLTSYESIQTDLKNAGANWVDEEVVVDDGLVTSRKPDDLPAFNQKLIEEVAEGEHRPREI